MNKKIRNSQVAENHSSINYSSNIVNINKIRKETIIISFIVGFLSSMIASYIYDMLFK